jgi:hypothetical protein
VPDVHYVLRHAQNGKWPGPFALLPWVRNATEKEAKELSGQSPAGFFYTLFHSINKFILERLIHHERKKIWI